MDNAREVLRKYLQLPGTTASWLYLNPDRIQTAFFEHVGPVEKFTISSSREHGGTGDLKFGGSGIGTSTQASESVDVEYSVSDPLVRSLLVQARAVEERILSDPCVAQIGDLVRFIARGRMSHPELPDTTETLREFYSPAMAEFVEEWRSARERDAKFVDQDAQCVVVAFGTRECSIANVLSKNLIRDDWPTRYNRGEGYLGVLGSLENIEDGLRLVAPLHIWWQPADSLG
jgi:hypothetical protein